MASAQSRKLLVNGERHFSHHLTDSHGCGCGHSHGHMEQGPSLCLQPISEKLDEVLTHLFLAIEAMISMLKNKTLLHEIVYY